MACKIVKKKVQNNKIKNCLTCFINYGVAMSIESPIKKVSETPCFEVGLMRNTLFDA